VPLDFNELRQLLVTIDQTNIVELTLKSEDFELTVRKAVGEINQLVSGMKTVTSSSFDTTGNQAVQSPVVAPLPIEVIISPMVGIFFRSPDPDAPPFVEVGMHVSAGQIICIIEAMKLMNEIETEVSGQVIEILVENEDSVEFNQPLMRIKPEA